MLYESSCSKSNVDLFDKPATRSSVMPTKNVKLIPIYPSTEKGSKQFTVIFGLIEFAINKQTGT